MKKYLALQDLAVDVAIELRARLSRTILLVMAVALSVGALLSSVGIARNAAHQIDADLAASTVNKILVAPAPSELERSSKESSAEKSKSLYPDNTEERLSAITTVEAAGRMLEVSSPLPTKTGRPFEPIIEGGPKVVAITSGYARAIELALPQESGWMLDGKEKVVFLGAQAAERLGVPITQKTEDLAITINRERYSVAGFLPGEHDLSNKVILPYRTGVSLVGSDRQSEVMIRTKIGAGSQIAKVARQVILPEAPERLVASQVVSSQQARDSVSTQMARQVAWVGLFLVILTVLLITNSMIVSVTARTTEIGVRRALGSSRAAVSAVFLFEGGLTGILGGLVGSAVSAWSIVGVAIVSNWTAKLSLTWIVIGPLLGAAVGLVASAYPAWRASKIQPAIAVRSN